MSTVLATDCGSTTTKAVLFERKSEGWRQTFRGEAPTTVEKPLADVTIGVRNAFTEIEELSGRKILKAQVSSEEESPILAKQSVDDPNGVDLYVSTSSAGGGLQMVVAGVVGAMTTASAERAALGAGAIVMDAIALDDNREPYERVQKIRHLRPDIVLISGGVDGGTKNHPLELAETVLQASPRPRFGETLRLPVIYAANKDTREEAAKILAEKFAFNPVANIRPNLETERLDEARDAIHELFLHHVMSHAPGYKKLLGYTPVPIIPTPAGFGEMVLTAAKQTGEQILAVDIGGATTDVFSVFRDPQSNEKFVPIFNRTVSANLGMSYSVANVLIEAGVENIKRWLPLSVNSVEIRDRLRNKMIRPTSIPQTMEDLLLEQAICREALRLALEHHQRLAVGLKGSKKVRALNQMLKDTGDELFDLMAIDLIIGSGGVLSHAPDRRSAALMLIDAYQPLGVTKLAVDSIFMMPHLGVLATVNADAAVEIFYRDCLVELGTVIAPRGEIKPGKAAVEISGLMATPLTIMAGEFKVIELASDERRHVEIKPLNANLDFGAGFGKSLSAELIGGPAGVIIDLRGRPLHFATDEKTRIERAKAVHKILGLEV
ncbi:MAG: glutamate mutase L [Deltaproteobacteria bacterium]|nr:glutamate mutase L [Deltaproteobacteria bacterium]